MGWRFRKSVKIIPGVRLNFGKSGISTSIGGRGATLNLGQRGTRATVDIPGSGVSYSTLLSAGGGGVTQPATSKSGSVLGWIVAVVLGLIVLGQCSQKSGSLPEATQSQEVVKRYVTAKSLNCRADASTNGQPVRSFARGDQVEVLSEQADWSQISGNPPCWSSSAFLASATPGPLGIASRVDGSGSSGGSSSGASSTAVQAAGIAAAGYAAGRAKASSAKTKKSKRKKAKRSSAPAYRSFGGSCPCRGGNVCIGPRGGRYCITSGGNKRYGV